MEDSVIAVKNSQRQMNVSFAPVKQRRHTISIDGLTLLCSEVGDIKLACQLGLQSCHGFYHSEVIVVEWAHESHA
jgi:hypothetical protein